MSRWLPHHKSTLVIRFLGTSPDSCNLRLLLQSICSQIHHTYKTSPKFQPADDVQELQLQFSETMKLGSERKPLVLILDSLDQLSPEYGAHKLHWLPRHLPPNCILLLSSIVDKTDVYDNFRRFQQEITFIHVPLLGEMLSCDILSTWLTKSRRRLTYRQELVVKEAFSKCSLPLYVKLVFEQAVRWRSYLPENRLRISHTITAEINDLLGDVEKKHGDLVVQRCLAYLTASKTGLSEAELEDILSLDDEVLTDVFQYHVPPIRRFPLILWLRINSDIDSYLALRDAEGVSVKFWYHRQFLEVAQSRYLPTETSAARIHSALADYFEGRWAGTPKPFRYTERQRQKLKLHIADAEADRKVASQPLFFCHETNVRYNNRKLTCLPYHLLQSNRLEDLKTTCLFSYEWLLTKLKAKGLQSIMQDINPLLDKDVECRLLRDALNFSRTTLPRNPSTLSCEILGRLLPFNTDGYPSIQRLVTLTLDEGYMDNCLVPLHQCYRVPGNSIKYTIEDSRISAYYTIISLSPNASTLYIGTLTNVIIVYDLKSGEVDKELSLTPTGKGAADSPEFNVCGFSSDKRFMVCGCAFQTNTNPIAIVDTKIGELSHCSLLGKCYPNIGFKDNLKLMLISDTVLLVIVLGKSVDCFALPSGECIKTFGFSPIDACRTVDGRYIAFVCCDTDYVVKIYSLSNFNLMTETRISSRPSGLIPLTLDTNTIEILFFYGNNSSIDSISCNFTAKTAKLSNIINDNLLQIQAPITGIEVLHTVDQLLLICTSVDLVIWSLKYKKLVNQFVIPDHIKPSYNVTKFIARFSSDGRFIIACYERHLLVWNVATGILESCIRDSSSLAIHQLIVSEDFKVAVTTAEKNRIVKVWTLDKMEGEIHVPLALNSPCRYISLAESGSLAAVRSYDPSEIRVVDIDSRAVISRPETDIESMQPMITPDGQSVVLRQYQADNNAVVVVDARTGSVKTTMPWISSLYLKSCACAVAKPYLCTHCEISPQDTDHTLTVWNINTGRQVAKLPSKSGGFSYIYFANNDRYIVALKQYPLIKDGRDCQVLLFDVQTQQNVRTYEHVLQESLYVLHDRQAVIFIQAATNDSEEDNVCFLTLKTLEVSSTVLSVSPVGRLSVSDDGTKGIDVALQFFHLRTGKVLARFDTAGEDLLRKTPNCWPKISPNGRYAVWLSIAEAMVKVGTEVGHVIGRCCIHSTPLTLQLSRSLKVIIGADDGRIMILRIVDIFGMDCVAVIEDIRIAHEQISGMQQKQQVKRGNGKQTMITGRNETHGSSVLTKPTSKSRTCSLL